MGLKPPTRPSSTSSTEMFLISRGCGERKHPAVKRVTKESSFGGWTVWEQEHHCHNKINVATCAISKSNRSTTTRTTRKATARARCLKSAIAKSHLVTLYFIHLIIYKKWISFQNRSFRPKKIRWKKEMARGRSDRRNLKVSKRRRNPVSDLLDPWDFFCFVWFGFGFGG